MVNTPTREFCELDERRVNLVLALLAAPDAKHVPLDYEVEILFEDRLCVVAGRNNPWTRRKTVDFRELSKEPWIVGIAGDEIDALSIFLTSVSLASLD